MRLIERFACEECADRSSRGLTTLATRAALVRDHREQDAACTILTAHMAHPGGHERIVHDKDERVSRVVEHALASEEEREIEEVNTSIYCFRRSLLAPALRRLSPENAQGE